MGTRQAIRLQMLGTGPHETRPRSCRPSDAAFYRIRAAVLRPEPIGLASGLASGEAAPDAQRQTAHIGGAIPLNGAPGKAEDAGQRAKTVGHPATPASRPSEATHPGPGTEPGAERLRNHTQSRVSGLGGVVHVGMADDSWFDLASADGAYRSPAKRILGLRHDRPLDTTRIRRGCPNSLKEITTL